MDAHVAFIGKLIPPGKSVTIAADFDDDELETIHFTQVALGPKPAKGPHTIFIENEDGKFAVGTLDREKCTQFSMDITIACDDVTISHTGESEVHITGYRTVAIVGLGEDDDEFEDGEDGIRLYRKGGRGSSDEDDDDDDDDDSDEESTDDEEPPRAVPLKNKKINNQLIENEASEGSSSDEEEEEEEDDSSEEEDNDSESEEEEEEIEPPAKSAKRKQAAAVAAQTPQPAKKAKASNVAKAPDTAPAKVGGLNGGESLDGDHTEFAAELKSFLQKNGPCKLSVLGSSVKRPPRSPKFKKLIEQNSDIFSFNPVTETVSLNLG